MLKEPAAEPGENVHLIVVEDEEIEIEHNPEAAGRTCSTMTAQYASGE